MTQTRALNPGQHFYTVKELMNTGLTHYKINQFVEAGKLVRLNKRIYENTGYEGDDSDFSYVSIYAPKGVVCMLSAARYHGLTTYLPESVDIAIERNMKISTLPAWPQFNIWYYAEKRYNIGVETASDGISQFRIYDIEKTVVDVLYYRNKAGIEETREILTNYLKRGDRNLIKLHRYAEDLGCKKILETYLEVLV